jgi:uncharacterized protein (DUF1330 family)
MLYYTQLIYVKPGAEEVFHAFEDAVLPLIQTHNGDLLYRIRPEQKSIIAGSGEPPYEVHIVTFPALADFENYKNDPQRLVFMHLKNQSVERIVLIEGKAL